MGALVRVDAGPVGLDVISEGSAFGASAQLVAHGPQVSARFTVLPSESARVSYSPTDVPSLGSRLGPGKTKGERTPGCPWAARPHLSGESCLPCSLLSLCSLRSTYNTISGNI